MPVLQDVLMQACLFIRHPESGAGGGEPIHIGLTSALGPAFPLIGIATR